MNKMPVLIASNSASDAHQTMFLRILQDCLLILMLCFTRILNICLHPNNILTSSKAPLFQTLSSEVKSLPRTTPQEDKGPLSGHVLNFEVHDVLPVPGVHVNVIPLARRWYSSRGGVMWTTSNFVPTEERSKGLISNFIVKFGSLAV